MKFEPVIGLEIHVQLKTKSKMFCPCDNTGELQPPNTTICPVCMGHPGTLPVPNEAAIRLAGQAALALNLRVNLHSKFDRKNYFYPDLPKGYQISQYDEPLAQEGYLDVETSAGTTRVSIERLHLEEDTAKLMHQGAESLIDFNRAGTPLMEIVTKPEIKTPAVAKAFLQELRLIMRYIGASDADMEKGHLRCDANISMRPVGKDKLYAKTEVKNLNSFRSVEKALQYEIERQTKLWEAGTPPENGSTRGWNDQKGVTVAQREKEAVHDYRYFPEPDIPPLELTKELLAEWQASLPELPAARRAHYQDKWGLPPKVAEFLLENPAVSNFVDRMVDAIMPQFDGDAKAAAKVATNWIVNKYLAILDGLKRSFESEPITPWQFADFIKIVVGGRVNSTNAQVLLRRMVETSKEAQTILSEEDLSQGGAGADGVEEIVKRVMTKYPDQAAQYRAGKEALLKFFVGAVMKEAKGKVDPTETEAVLKRILSR